MGAVAVYTLLVGGYLCYFERRQPTGRPPKIGDIFDILTYRERYEDLLAEQTRNGGTPPNSSPRPRRTVS
jgi:hypothetical protein